MELEKRLNDLVELVDKQSETILEELSSMQIKDVKFILKQQTFELNPTKRKLVEILEEKLVSKINEQRLTI